MHAEEVCERVRGVPADWSLESKVAREAAIIAGRAIRADFGKRQVTARKGPHDVQLSADVRAHEVIAAQLEIFDDDMVISEESSSRAWGRRTWLVDPLDGTNNFGFGVGHCAITLTLFDEGAPRVAVVRDPLLGREFVAIDGAPFVPTSVRRTPLAEATVSLVSGYDSVCRATAATIDRQLTRACKRTLNLWAPSLDLALIADGALDAMVAVGADLLDVAAGMYVLMSSGGVVLDPFGHDLTLSSDLFGRPLTFTAARDRELAETLLNYLE